MAVIPARGGSKGVPRKNLQRVGGCSLIERAVATALQAQSVDRVVVSTDDSEIAAVAEAAGAEVVLRPAHLADDVSSSEAAVLHVLDTRRGRAPDVTVLVQCTSPFTTSRDLDGVLAPVLSGEADSAFSAVPFHGFIWRVDDGSSCGVNHDHLVPRQRRQDRPSEWLETGAAYAFNTDGFRRAGTRFFGRIQPAPTDTVRAIEIDSPEDLQRAQNLAPSLDRQPVDRLPRLVALDFDGVFTDNTVYVDEAGRESVRCHRGDGHGLARLREHVRVVVFSTEENPVVAARCRKLELEVLQGLGERKAAALERYTSEHGIALVDVLYVGNDVNDLECLALAGIPVAVQDAVSEVRAVCRVVLQNHGGRGALRELCDNLLELASGPDARGDGREFNPVR